MSEDPLREISREALNELPVRRYEGAVNFVASPAQLHAARLDVLNERVIGFDTETRPAFRKGESYLPSIAQVATAEAVHIFPLRYPDTHRLLAELLASADIVKAGVALANDLRTLKQRFDFSERRVVDLGVVAKRNGYAQSGVRNLAGLALGFRIVKGAKTTNWAAAQLSPAQIAYAATDAWVCRELFLRFESSGLVN